MNYFAVVITYCKRDIIQSKEHYSRNNYITFTIVHPYRINLYIYQDFLIFFWIWCTFQFNAGSRIVENKLLNLTCPKININFIIFDNPYKQHFTSKRTRSFFLFFHSPFLLYCVLVKIILFHQKMSSFKSLVNFLSTKNIFCSKASLKRAKNWSIHLYFRHNFYNFSTIIVYFHLK